VTSPATPATEEPPVPSPVPPAVFDVVVERPRGTGSFVGSGVAVAPATVTRPPTQLIEISSPV